MNSSQLIAYLNAIQVGDLDVIRTRILEAKQACVDLSQPDLAEKLAEALAALDGLDTKTYRRRIETVISRLGHIR
ncbi:MAG: hypothetical protein OEV00_04260 [Acidobacteriota bacterium]|nr:hypothetical protein [Acidobacteriota bacterium]MDH3784526.1 hypothetical protein [Acidobacteriota bacterium]